MTDTRLVTGLCAALALAMLAGLAIGPAALGFGDVLQALMHKAEPRVATVILELRLPRVILAVLVGAALAGAGAALQGLLHNPLADPSTVGISAGGALGAVVAIYLGLAVSFPLALPLFAILGCFAGTLALYLLARQEASVLTLILAGVAITYVATALTALAINFSPNPFALSDIVLWLLGSLSNRSFADVVFGAPFMLAGLALLLTARRDLDALTLGEDVAATLGVDLRRLRWTIILGSALAVGGAVSVAGSIGFVGLVVPHLIRPLVGHQPSRVLLPAMLGGALLLLAADAAVRLAPGGQELKLGVVTSLIGGPMFFHLIVTTRRSLR